MTAGKQIRFLLTEDALYAANAGRPFDRLGLLSVTRAHLSTKGRYPPIETYDCVDEYLVDAMRTTRLGLYRQDPNQIRADFNQQHETERSYEGRCIWELLQNADDALAPENTSSADLIGAKGLGFKSVLEFTDRPAIFSGPFTFEFDADKSRPLLLPIDPDAPPLVFHLPHKAEDDVHVARLKREGFSTVVRLPFRNETARLEAASRLNDLTPYFLLLSQHLASVEIRFADGRRRTLSRTGPTGGDAADARVRLSVRDGDALRAEDWRLWSRVWAPADAKGKRLSVAIAVPSTEGDQTDIPELPLHVFFPTRETVGTRFLVHAAFTLAENRNSIVRGEHDADLIKAAAAMAAEVAAILPPLQAIRLFSDVVRGVSASSRLPARKLQRAIAEAVSSADFIPIIGSRSRARPSEVRVWHHDLGPLLPVKSRPVAAEKLVAPSVAAGFGLLQNAFKVRSLYSAEYASILEHVVCECVADCRAAVAVAKTACVGSAGLSASALERLALIPMWPTTGGAFRPLSGSTPLVDAASDDWPVWLGSDVLHPDFGDAASDGDLPPAARANWSKLLKGRLLRSRDDRLAHALAPQVAAWSDEQWAEHGWDVLALIRSWLGELDFQKIKPFAPGLTDPADLVRDKLAHAMRAPCRNAWVPTIDAYASEDLKGPEGLAKFMRGKADRYVVGKPKQAGEVGSWRGLLRYLGVSWEPKLRRITGWMPIFNRFQRATDGSFRSARPDWCLEFFPECLEDVGSVTVIRMLETLAPVTAALPARWVKVGGSIKDHRVPRYGSFAHWQLCCEPYLKCRPGIGSTSDRLAPESVYWPDLGLRGVTPVIELHQADGARKKALKALFVGRLRVKDELPREDEVWLEWSKAIACDVGAESSRLTVRDIRAFYEAALEPKRLTAGALKSSLVVCETADGLKACSAKSAVWIDGTDLAAPDIQAALREAGQAIFPVQLSRGERIEEIFGVRRASTFLRLTPSYLPVGRMATDDLQSRLRSRRRAIAVTLETKLIRGWAPPNVQAVRGLTLEIALGDQAVGLRSVQAYRDRDQWLVSLDGDRWDALARACVGGLPAVQAADLRRRIAAILTARREDVPSVLIEDGIPPYRLADLLLEDEPEHDGPEEPEVEESLAPSPAAEPDATTDPDQGASSEPGPSLEEIRNTPEPTGSVKLAKRELFGSGRSQSPANNSKGKAGAGEAARQASLRGLTAEAWFALQVEKTRPDGWEAFANERDADSRETDLVISDGVDRWHIEIKNLTTERLYWSELERSKAVDLPGRYFMALLIGTHEEGYHVYWVWDPLAQLGVLDRRLDWVWSDTSEGPPLPPTKWAPPPGYALPQKSPTRWNHVVRVTQSSLDAFARDRSDLGALWTQLSATVGSGALQENGTATPA